MTDSRRRGVGEAIRTAGSTLVLARHGQTVWHAENRYAGAGSDIDLTETGRRQAAQLAGWARARNPDAVVCSPVRRAVETARPCADAAGRPLRIVDDLREVDFGIAEGHTLAEVESVHPETVRLFRTDPALYPFPEAEPPESAAGRCATALRDVAAAGPATVLVIAHNTVLRLAMCTLLGLPIGRYRQLFPRLVNGAVTELLLPPDRSSPASLISLNVPVGPP